MPSLPLSASLLVEETTQVGDARRRLGALSAESGFDETQAGRLALLVTEAGNNLVKHARGGRLIYRMIPTPSGTGIELLSVDSGPGMADVPRCLSDGYSTIGTSGTGLGALRRLSSFFDIHSAPGAGTVILMQVFPRNASVAPPLASAWSIGGVSVALRGETVCGDGWDVTTSDRHAEILISDGLGHGPAAHQASEAAIRAFRSNAARPPAEVIQAAHLALRSTRGAAVGVARLEAGSGLVRFAGVGNTAAMVVDPAAGKTKHLLSHSGTLGLSARKITEFTQPWSSGSSLVLHTDGILSRWDLDRYPGVWSRHPSVIAAVILRDFSRGSDDATVVVAKEGAGAA